ncbi:ZYRO0C16632p [Zygosaccharomyces rouxii]|uniref:transketolase n=1 Tax=Zygosaccharomyces rouxii (strain ATCC 2623 / CBS 732 / NBRC 1130 / NCYC 568 / NRRL Y-229) TaxID=559307 RepID=C5DUG8_ZYGRC|nr:uncharacterized protein ZYRO0C16632g [Zygosaccharomyces rouxii]KAH9201401.1 Transketolase, thiamine diphosphate binding domain-containing protein [Zygosaccharomyces rouxii]CAR27429.1 ZYRO0C16632p [Zygosaccharomyces rouxii]
MVAPHEFSKIDDLAIRTLKLLAVDQPCNSNSGHPGAPLALAPAAHALLKATNINPKNPDWINRDRFVLSNGHACALLYALLHLVGNDYFRIEDLKQFRKLNSRTPGHPEFHLSGVEVTTGPLGQGIANAVGMAIAQKNFAATYNKPGFTISDNHTFVFAGDGCLQEGISSEASSLAGHLQLGNLIMVYDNNSITIDGSTNLSFTEDTKKRYKAYGWEVIDLDGDSESPELLLGAIEQAKKTTDKPTMIRLTTIIGHGSLNQGTHGVHGAPLKADDLAQLKEKLGFDPKQSFVVPQEVYDFYRKTVAEPGIEANEKWDKLFAEYQKKYPEEGKALVRRLSGELPADWDKTLPAFTPKDKAVATRKLSEGVIEQVYNALPELIGGSADLTPSNLTRWVEAEDFQPPSSGLGSYKGRYIRYGVREHGMAAILNGISAWGANYKPYGGTFLNFVSYASGAVRLSALSGHPVIYVATHDSIGVGEDGPTHQPIETLAHFRALPNMHVWRPADGNEVSGAYKNAIESKHTPAILALSRQNLPQLEGSCRVKTQKGAYVLQDVEKPDVVLIATGSEVSLIVESAKVLAAKGIKARIVSAPCLDLFDEQSEEYRVSVLPDGVPIMSVEVASTVGWERYAHQSFGINRFGVSAPCPDAYKYFDFVPEGVASRAEKTVAFYKGKTLYTPVRRAFESPSIEF